MPEEIIESAAPQAAEPDRHALLTEQFTEVEHAQPEAPAETAKQVQGDTPAQTSGRQKDPVTGRFVPKAGDTQQTAPNPATAPVVEPAWKKPPKSWKVDLHELYGTADPRLQEHIHAREEQMRKGVEGVLTKAQFADQMQKVIEPHMQTIRGLGIDAPRAVGALMDADRRLRDPDPAKRLASFRQLAQQYQIPLEGMQAQPGQQPTQQNFAMAQELNELRGLVRTFIDGQEREKNASLVTEIDQFAADPKNEHFESVRPTMVKLLNSGAADTLADAYKKAIRLDDNLFAQSQASQGSEEAARQATEKDKVAKLARSAAVSVRSSTPGAPTQSKAQDRRSKLAESFSGLDGRL